MEYKKIDLEKIKNPPIEKGNIFFADKNGKLKFGKIIFPNEDEKDKTILFSILISDANGII